MWYKSSLHLTILKGWKFTGNTQHILGTVQVSVLNLHVACSSLNPRLSDCKKIFLNKNIKKVVFKAEECFGSELFQAEQSIM